MTSLAIPDPKLPIYEAEDDAPVTMKDLRLLLESMQNLEVLRNTNFEALERERVIIDKVSMGRGTTGGGVVSWINPLGVRILTYGLILDITSLEATATSPTLSIGVDNTATGTSNTLIDQLSVAGAGTAVYSAFSDGGTAGRPVRAVPANNYIVGSLTVAGGTPTEFAGNLYIAYVIA